MKLQAPYYVRQTPVPPWMEQQLLTVGPPVLAMLEEGAEFDPLLVLWALEAAGLLDDVGLPDDCRTLWSKVREAAKQGAPVVQAAVEALDLTPGSIDFAPDCSDAELDRRLEGLVSLAGVHEVLPPGPISAVLQRNALWLNLHPLRAYTLLSAAEAYQAGLDLPAEHAVHALLAPILQSELAGLIVGRTSAGVSNE